ncbi:MAG TPA: GIY-YIG nuclease family protein [Patescibacteria group bacterium]
MNKPPKDLPTGPGVYKFCGVKGNILYVGKAINLKSRIGSYFANRDNLGPKTKAMVQLAKSIEIVKVESEIEALLLEAALISKHLPKFNSELKDDRSPIYIKITVGNEIPLITTARRQKKTKGVKIFGPFPSSSNVRSVLKILRRIFPYCTHQRRQKSCLYVHLGLCPDPFASQRARLDYKKTIKNILMFLNGEKKRLILNLIKEMQVLSNNQEFENANKIKKQIDAINYVTQNFRQPEEYLKAPDLIEDLANEKIQALQNVLGLTIPLIRIECYDISNTQGKQATGSMVVFTNGLPDISEYRKFKIKLKNTPDDYSMIKEVIYRRLKNDWTKPNLFVIDGGKGQLSAAKSILDIQKVTIPIISLAKRLEEIYLPDNSEPISLRSDSSAILLLRHIRDESHRFAIFYHRKLRIKAFLQKKI